MSRTKRMITALAALTLSLTGCSDDDASPTAPGGGEEAAMDLLTHVTITKVDVLADGDGIEGRGEFWFVRQIGGTSFGWGDTLSTGESSVVNWTATLATRNYTGEGRPFIVRFTATEYDRNILGETYADSDMDGRSATANYVTSPDLHETNYITLGNDQCRVRMHYTIVSSLVPAEDRQGP